MKKQSTTAFKKRLRAEVEELCQENSWDPEQDTGRGYGFQLWCAKLLCREDKRLETEPLDSLLYSNDLGADIVLEDTTNKSLIIAQCKFRSLSKPVNLKEDEFISFFNKHSNYSDRKWVRKHGSESTFDLLGDYGEKVKEGYRVYYYFLSTCKKQSERQADVVQKINKDYEVANLNIECVLFDIEGLKSFFVRSETIEESIPDSIKIDLPSDSFLEKEEPYPSVVAIVKGSAIVDLFRKEKHSLFAFNIRDYLGDRGINKDITATADSKPSDFFYFNNGISAVCTNFEINKNSLTATKFQVINGAQTVGALHKSIEGGRDVEVLLRITKTKSVSTEKGINEEIIRYSNSQNAIKVSDFRSNDLIQLYLERRLNERKGNSVLPKLFYQRKRSNRRARAGAKSLSLEDLAKIRYSFMHEPTLAIGNPRDLWTSKSNGGVYEKIFGVDDQLVDVWDEDMCNETLLAIAVFLRLDERIKDAVQNSVVDLRSLRRLKLHALSLIGAFMMQKMTSAQVAKLLTDDKLFTETFGSLWKDAFKILANRYYQTLRDGGTIHGLSRNTVEWDYMKNEFLDWQAV